MEEFSDFKQDFYTFDGKEFSHDPMMTIVDSGGNEFIAYTVINGMTVEQAKTISYNNKIKRLRELRDEKIAESDWRANVDVASMSDEWRTYRQALRDLPSTMTSWDDFETFAWPTEPS